MEDKKTLPEVLDKEITKIEIAPSSKIDELRPHVDQVLEAIGHPEALVTDESMIWDFSLSDEEIDTAVEKLPTWLTRMCYIIEVAERLKKLEVQAKS